jgi:SAM-dependent methyltransferase
MTSENHYSEKYFEWQSHVGIFGATANIIKFNELIKPNQKVLDFGCGGGYMLAKFANIDKFGVEVNDIAREDAKKNLKVYKYAKELPDNFFDLVISNHALEHCDNPLLELKELYRCLKKDGIICIVVPIDNKKNYFKKNDRFFHLYSWSPMNLGNILTAAGFDVIESKLFNHKWIPFYARLKKIMPWSFFHLLCKIYGSLSFHDWWQTRAIAKKN